MIIVGAKGFAKEVLEVLTQLNEVKSVFFFDDISPDLSDSLYDLFKILKSMEEVIEYFKYNNDKRFVLGVGGPVVRKKLSAMFTSAGGELCSVISPMAKIGHYGNLINSGVNIMTGAIITNDVRIGEGTLINLNCTVGHDCKIGDYVEMSPGVHVSGRCIIGDLCSIGTNATLLPGVKLGRNVVVGAGAVVTMEIPDNSLVVGIPAKIIKSLDPIE